jgi:hypothetical protein
LLRACGRCTAAKKVTGMVILRARARDYLCLRHQQSAIVVALQYDDYVGQDGIEFALVLSRAQAPTLGARRAWTSAVGEVAESPRRGSTASWQKADWQFTLWQRL